MAKDLKVIQRGVNVQDNDLAVAPGTLQHAVNVDFFRGGVASKRTGFESMFNGLPQYEVDSSYNPSDVAASPVNRSMWELFSRDRLMMNANGMIFAYDEALDYWYSVPANLPHRFTLFGTTFAASTFYSLAGFGNAIGLTGGVAGDVTSPFILENTKGANTGFFGTICNDASQAKIATSGSGGTIARYRRPGDVVIKNNVGGKDGVVSDDTSIRLLSDGSVIAGVIATPGSTNGTGAAASFSGASWMATDGADTVWVADNANMIRKVIVSTGVVTTLAGTVAAGDADGTGVAATFRGISGLAYDGSAFLYVSESGGHRIRRVNVGTGAVTIFAGLLVPTSGYLDATGTAARFNTPTGIEMVGSTLYVGDSGNNRIRTLTTGAVVGTLNNVAGTAATDGLVGNVVASAITPGVVVRGQYLSQGATPNAFPQGTYLAIECTPTVTAATIDCGLVNVTAGSVAAQQHVYHYARCPSAYPTATTGPNKFDSIGPNAYSFADTRGVDVGSGVAFNTCARPRALDIWTKLATTDTMPRLRELGVLQPEAPVATTTAGATFAAGTSWAYRYLCGLNLPDGRITTGPPSERVIVTNATGGALAGSITCFPAPGLPYDGMPFFQVYRTKTTASASTDPGDQMFLCYETPITYGSGLVFTDLTPDGLLGAELYTNQTADGSTYSSLPPPSFASELSSFKQQLVLGNYIPQASVRVKMIGTGPLVAGTSTVTITQGPGGGFSTYKGAALVLTAIAGVTVPASNQFQIGTGGSAAQNAAQTARNIVSCINRSPDAYFFQAFYDENDPGAFVVTSLYPGASKTVGTTRSSGQTLTQSSVTFTTNTTLAFFTVQSNIATRLQNSAIYSDVNAPDSMPASYQFNVGPATEAIQRILPIADRALVVKDDSVWSIDQQFSPQIYDTALSTNFPNSFAKINNQWIGLFTRGFCALNATQAVATGHVIDRDVIAQFANKLGSINFVSAAAIDVYGNYLCTVNDRTFCYNLLSQSWSEWQINTMAAQTFYNTLPPPVVGAGIARASGMQSIGAFRDCFVANRDFARAVFRQRDFRRGGNPIIAALGSVAWFQNYADMAFTFTGTLAADLQTITGTYSNAANPGLLPPNNWQIPSGAGSVTVGAAFLANQFPWALAITQGSVTAIEQGSVQFANEQSVTSAYTMTAGAGLAFDGLSAGAVTVVGYAPILNRLQFAPSVKPGSNNQFGDVLITMERLQGGPLGARFFNRRDAGSPLVTAVGAFTDSYGYARVATMAPLGSLTQTLSGVIGYDDIQRIPAPSERSADQQLILELWEGAAWQPLALKSVTIDDRELLNGKVKR